MDHTFLMEVMEANEKVEHTSDTQVLLHMKEQYMSKHKCRRLSVVVQHIDNMWQ